MYEEKKFSQFCHSLLSFQLNLGCPQYVARKGRYGAFLCDDKEAVLKIVEALSKAVKIPVFCKIRLLMTGLSDTVNFAKMLESAGCSVLAVHGRNREQKGTRF